MGNDKVYGFNSISYPYFNFGEYNSGGDCTYGQQMYVKRSSYPNNIIDLDKLGGVSGVAGVSCSLYWNYLNSVYY